jgi:hypothetical protein
MNYALRTKFFIIALLMPHFACAMQSGNDNIQINLDLKKLEKETTITLPPLSQASQNLFDAIENSDKQSVIDALKNGADVNAYNEHGRIPLGWLLTQHLTKKHHKKTTLEIASLLLEKKELDINKHDGMWGTNPEPIIFTVLQYEYRTTELGLTLLKHILAHRTFDPQCKSYCDKTPLDYAQGWVTETSTSKHAQTILKLLKEKTK